MKRMLVGMGIILLAMSGCVNAKPLSVEERLAREYYRLNDTGYLKEMVGVTYELLNEGKFVISNKGSYDLSSSIVQVKSCKVNMETMEVVDGTSCNKRQYDRAIQIYDAFEIELGRLNLDNDELLKFLKNE